VAQLSVGTFLPYFNGIGTFHRVVNHNLHASTVSGTVERRDISPFGIYMGPSWVCDVEDEIQVVRRVGVGMSVQTNLCPTPKIVCRMQAYCTYQLQILVSAVQFACWEWAFNFFNVNTGAHTKQKLERAYQHSLSPQTYGLVLMWYSSAKCIAANPRHVSDFFLAGILWAPQQFHKGTNLLNVVAPVSAIFFVSPEDCCAIRCGNLTGRSRKDGNVWKGKQSSLASSSSQVGLVARQVHACCKQGFQENAGDNAAKSSWHGNADAEDCCEYL